MKTADKTALQPFTRAVIAVIGSIPRGRVATYGQIAAMAGNHRAARQVSRILHSSSRKHGLPWHRVINGKGTISLLPGNGYEEQRRRLEAEGIGFDVYGRIDLDKQGWRSREE